MCVGIYVYIGGGFLVVIFLVLKCFNFRIGFLEDRVVFMCLWGFLFCEVDVCVCVVFEWVFVIFFNLGNDLIVILLYILYVCVW